jgi:hypothetical protein
LPKVRDLLASAEVAWRVDSIHFEPGEIPGAQRPGQLKLLDLLESALLTIQNQQLVK